MTPTPASCGLGLGMYTLPEAARLLAVPTRTLRRWAKGYTFRTGDELRISAPVIRRQLPDSRVEGALTFLDLMELHFVRMFRQQGVSMAVIRAAAAEGTRLFGSDHPFAVKRFNTDGKAVFATLEQSPVEGVAPARLVEELHVCQIVFADMVEPFFRRLDLDREEVSRYWPLGKDRSVAIDPHRAFGKPIDSGSGVRTFALYEASLGHHAPREIAAWYGVTVDAVLDAIEFEGMLAAA